MKIVTDTGSNEGTVGAEASVLQNCTKETFTEYMEKAVGLIIGKGCVLQTVDKSC